MRYYEINNQIRVLEFCSEKELIKKLSYDLNKKFDYFIKKKNRVNFVTSGGNTPRNLYTYLSNMSICWSKINLCLSDERIYEKNFPKRNESMLVKKLLKKNILKTSFISPYELFYGFSRNSYNKFYKNIFPIDIILLGMGLDGHIASLIPNTINLKNAIYENKNKFYLIRNKYNFSKRISISLSAINESKFKIIFIKGNKKMEKLKDAFNGEASISNPISLLKKNNLNIYWCPND